jgi:hypothetical protein
MNYARFVRCYTLTLGAVNFRRDPTTTDDGWVDLRTGRYGYGRAT